MVSKTSVYISYERYLLKMLYLQAKLLAIFSLVYDRSKNKLVKRPLYIEVIHCICIYGTIFGLMTAVSFLSDSLWIEIAGRNLVLFFAEVINGSIVLLAVFATFTKNFINRESISRLAGMMVLLNVKYFRDPPSDIQRNLFLRLILKHILTTSIVTVHSIITLINFKSIGLESILLWLCGLIVTSTLETVIIMFYGSVVYLTKYYEMLNDKLQRVISETQNLVHLKLTPFEIMAKSCDISDRLDELGHLYKKVFRAHDGLVDLYQLQILAIILSAYVNNVVMAFNAYSERNVDRGNFYLLVSCTILQYFDVVLIIDVCQSNISTATNARKVVSKYPFVGFDERLDRSVSFL